MKSFKTIPLKDACEQRFPEAYDSLYHDYAVALYEFEDDVPVRLVAVDGGEPEDQTFGRDWKWVVEELNALCRVVNEGAASRPRS